MPSVVPFVIGQPTAVDDMDESILPRPGLLNSVINALQNKVSVFHAPAGSGKSVLIAQLYRHLYSEQPVTWLALDEFDKDPVHFFKHLCLAVRHVAPQFQGFSSLQHYGNEANELARQAKDVLLHAFAQLDQPLLIIVDKIEELAGQSWLSVLSETINESPLRIRWLLSGRNTQGIDPFYWPQQDDFRVFGVSELFFNPEETRILVQKNLATELDENALRSLFRLTKGWPAAIKLAQIYYQSSSPQTPLPAVVPGGGSLFRFLLKNTLDTLPSDLVKFLICSSFLEQLTIPLCDHLLGIRNSAQHIKTLVQLGLLMECNLLQPGEFHYHALLQDHLLQEFTSLGKVECDRLVARACLWRIDHNQREIACRVAYTHGSPAIFTALLQQCLLEWLLTGETDPVFRWLRQLDVNKLRDISHARLAKSWSLTMLGEFVQAEEEIYHALGGLSGITDCMPLLQPDKDMETSALGVVYVIIQFFRGTMDEQLAAQLQQFLNHRTLSNSHRSSFENLLAGYAIFHCRFEEARERASRAASAMASMGNRLGYALSTYMVANSHYLSNDIKNARLTCTNYLQQPDLDSGATARLLMQSFENYLDYQGLSPLAAENRIQDLLLVHQPAYTVELQLYLTLPLLHMRTRRKDFAGAHFLLTQLEHSARTGGAFQLQVHALYERVRLAYAKGDSNELEQLEQTHELLATGKRLLLSDVTTAWESVERPILAAILLLLHRGDLVQASQWLQQLQYLNVDFGQPIRFLPINLCMAYVEFRLSRISMAYRRLNDTLTGAEATGMLAGLLDDIPGLDDFVKTALEQGRIQNPQHAEKLHNLGFF